MEKRDFGWTKGLLQLSMPGTWGAWLLILIVCPLTTGFFAFLDFVGWFNLEDIQMELVGSTALLLPIGAHLLPTSRNKGGGCCLGCFVWISMAMGTIFASSYFSFDDPVRRAEVAPEARLSAGPCQVDGISLGDSLAKVKERLGAFKERPYPYVVGQKSVTLENKDGTLVTILEDRVLRVRGKSLSQGEVLLTAGQHRSRIAHLFAPSAYEIPRLRYVRDGVLYNFELEKDEVSGVAMASRDYKLRLGPSRFSVNGIALGVPRSELDLEQAEGERVRLGEASAEFNGLDRTRWVYGTQLELNGKVVAQADTEMSSRDIGKLVKHARSQLIELKFLKGDGGGDDRRWFIISYPTGHL